MKKKNHQVKKGRTTTQYLTQFKKKEEIFPHPKEKKKTPNEKEVTRKRRLTWTRVSFERKNQISFHKKNEVKPSSSPNLVKGGKSRQKEKYTGPRKKNPSSRVAYSFAQFQMAEQKNVGTHPNTKREGRLPKKDVWLAKRT